MMIADNIKRLRENAGLSQAALARRLGVTRASVNAWEMELSAPTAQYLIALAQLFHTTTDDMPIFSIINNPYKFLSFVFFISSSNIL